MRIDADLPPWWREVFSFTEPVPSRVADKISAAGDSGLRAVCAVLDPAFGVPPIPRASEDARAFCAHMLARFARPELVPWMSGLMTADPDDPVVPHLAGSLAACGASAVEFACAEFAESERGDALRPWLAEIAAHGGVRSDEAFAVLVTYLQDDPLHAAGLLHDYGDPAAADALLVEFDRTVTEGPDSDPQILATIGAALTALGAELDPARAERLRACDEDSRHRAIEQRRRFIEIGGFDAIARPEGCDPCPCESGAKYADCCSAIEAEMAERHRASSRLPRPF